MERNHVNDFAWCFCIIAFVILAVVLFMTDNQKDLISSQKVEINRLELKVEDLENICRWEKVLIQLLNPVQKEELDLFEEQIKQGKEGKCKQLIGSS